MPDAVVVGSGPNGLAAAIQLARSGRSVTVYEANHDIGGGARSAELTLPGFVHDVCSAFHPMAAASPFFRTLPLDVHGLTWIQPAPLAHPLDDGTAVLLHRSLDTTAQGLGEDGDAYRRLMSPFVDAWRDLYGEVLRPIVHVPRHPFLLARFGLSAIWSARMLVRRFRGARAPALLAGIAAHSFLPLEHPLSSSAATLLGSAGHAVGWPIARGGSRSIATALASYLASLGGAIVADRPVQEMADLPDARAYLFDTSPATLERVASDRLSPSFRRSLRQHRRGPGVFKLDYALDGPVPWRAADCLVAGTVHLGGTFDEIAASERAVWRGQHPDAPFVLVGQQSLFDDTRAPAGKHTLWAYCHVPNGSTVDMTERIEAQIERFAPGFRQRVLKRVATTPADIERENQNDAGGDIGGGTNAGLRLLFRPRFAIDPYATSARDITLCSASTPPGGGVHGMCGYHGARSALRRSLS